MKYYAHILNLLLASALILLAVKMTMMDSAKLSIPELATNTTLETIFKRTSVRSFTAQKVEEEDIELLLRAAMAAPTAVNKQPWAFVVVNERELLDQLATSLPFASMLSTANLAIVVCGDLTKALLDPELAYWAQDCSAATQNLLLAAESIGLGAVWTGVFPRPERIDTVRTILNIPAHLVPLNVIPIGYPSGETVPKDKWNPAVIHYNRY